MKLAYCAYDQGGKQISGTIESASVAAGTDALAAKGLYVTEIAEAAAGSLRASLSRGHKFAGGKTKRLKSLAMFTRQLMVLLQSGTQLVEALGALERQINPGPWRDTICDLRLQVEQGTAMSQAMGDHPAYFTSVYRALIAAGEAGGELVTMLDRLATLSQKQLKIRNAIVGAMIYPALLMVLGASVFAVLLIFVVPRFGELFESLGMPLPTSTKALLTVSDIFCSYGWLIAGCLVGGFFGLRLYLRSPAGRRMWDVTVLKLPHLGKIVRSFTLARITRLLGVLMEGHVSVIEALELTRAAAKNCRYEQLIANAQECVSKGQPISQAFADSDLVTPSVYEAIRSGERAGQVGPLLQTIANFLDEDNDVIVRTMTSIIEPIILIFMGALVALVAISMFMPLFDLTSMASGGG